MEIVHSSGNRALISFLPFAYCIPYLHSICSSPHFQSENIQIFPITVASTFVTLSWNTSSALSTGRKGYVLQVRRHRGSNGDDNGGGGGGGGKRRNRSRQQQQQDEDGGAVRLGGRGSNADPEIIKQ